MTQRTAIELELDVLADTSVRLFPDEELREIAPDDHARTLEEALAEGQGQLRHANETTLGAPYPEWEDDDDGEQRFVF